jgi:hypothetical protein
MTGNNDPIPHVDLLDRAAILAAIRRQEGHPEEADLLVAMIREVREWRERALRDRSIARLVRRLRASTGSGRGEA